MVKHSFAMCFCSCHRIISYTHTDCTNGAIRLDSCGNEGTIEVCIDSIWGLISESGWTIEDGQVVCRQLGYHVEGTKLTDDFGLCE